jgi:hypothetical protein
MEKVFALLISAHFFVDFFLLPACLEKRKQAIPFLALHSFIHAVVAYLFLQMWSFWQLPLAVFCAHFLIDAVAMRFSDTYKAFAAEQTAHIGGLVVIAFVLQHTVGLPAFTGFGFRLLMAIGGFFATVQGAGDFVGKFIKPLLIQQKNQLESDGLIDGGAWIGRLERALIFLFIFIGYPAGIGFLVTAKSILRFEEAKKTRQQAEYVLIGTFWSYSLAIALTSATQWAMKL